MGVALPMDSSARFDEEVRKNVFLHFFVFHDAMPAVL